MDVIQNIKTNFLEKVQEVNKNEKDIYLDLEKQKSELINLIHSGDIETIHSQEPCLEDIFINLTGEKINDKQFKSHKSND